MPRLKCSCGKSIPYDPDEAGEKVRCPKCKKSLVIPGDEDEDEDDLDEEGEESPKPGKGRRKGPDGALAGMGMIFFSLPGAVLILVALTVGAGLLAWGIYEYRVSTGAVAEPTNVRCADVIARGIPANAHVTLTDFKMAGNYVYAMKVPKSEVEKAQGGGGSMSGMGGGPSPFPWMRAYVPLFPWTDKQPNDKGTPIMPNPLPENREIRLLLLTAPDVRSSTELAKATEKNKVQGLLRPAARALDAETREQLAKYLSGIDLERLIVLEEGRRPSSPAFTTLLIAGGSVFLFLALCMGVIGVAFHPR